MVRLARLGSCCLNQWSMDFESNQLRILDSLRKCEAEGVRYRLGPELEVSGYGCEDHFLERDTVEHGYEVLAWLLQRTAKMDLLCDVGMAFEHRRVVYNCRVFFLHGRILLIRPKLQLAGNGNYRESRWFTRWSKLQVVEQCSLPKILRVSGQTTVPIGDAILQLNDARIAAEICEELWCASPTHINMWLNGVDIVSNGSGSHHNLRKLDTRVDSIKLATSKCGGVYMYANQRGCDGGRLYFDGSSMIVMNGQMMAQGKQFCLDEVDVIVATVDLDDVASYPQNSRSSMVQADSAPRYPVITVDFCLAPVRAEHCLVSRPSPAFFHTPEEEISLGPALWLWDYLRRSNQAGFFLPLSGGVDSASVACVVANMCHILHEGISANTAASLENLPLTDLQRLVKDTSFVPKSPQEIAGKLLTTCYMATKNSSAETRDRADKLATLIGSRHSVVYVDGIVDAVTGLVTDVCDGKKPQFMVNGGSHSEDVALQNMQARSRMVTAYTLAQLLPWSRGTTGSLLVLGTANVDEALRGYYTKYDCSAADINPIGGISKTDLRMFLAYCVEKLQLGNALGSILTAPPTAELRPLKDAKGAVARAQTDEEDMGMTYDELSVFGRLRKLDFCGPVEMFRKLAGVWPQERGLSLQQIAQKVQHFFTQYSINRHKMTTLTPAYHAEDYSPDDNRFDLRQFLYNVRWPFQFQAMKRTQSEMEQQQQHLVSATDEKAGQPDPNSSSAANAAEPDAKRKCH
ncbi:glutamine-dependent NAD(+) synthetase-like [Sycon ciliatum]|uniref:glutamine-dependent NAD(+) synthetase-like n=1 Tax=Sycon ciliatum TaxID=27933 RepID=UPI0020A94291|eukprot:scpid42442/ scgid16368/ Glutamine-dependent NAD(+) synthetase; NAD(+) synthase [glutamine-hydrolyzing]; NAD(+) synthetase; NH3-dependent NAD(+) synthetase-like protein